MQESLDLYGYDQPSIFYTDSMADKEFLEKCFPSLHKDLVSVEKYLELPALAILQNIPITLKKSVTAINDVMRTILDLLPEEEDENWLPIVIGLDV